ncbi:MAG: RdgB/HAM1 family non-canonical purine NTP pyrophosphatase [Synergistaceae bacterium]|jgi:XTP/dITP diphosphohydrolase|nr:RdgB/HAM1 family non-canonical purine NTP pyrophosphatase [Synergistaceae bacterium]
MKIVLASGNKNKFYEIKEVLEKIQAELLFGGDFPNYSEVQETEDSYYGNALLKARSWARVTGLPAMADDSGIEVSALDGAPGIHSARIVPGSDEDRVEWLLNSLKDKEDRSAKFVCCIVVFFPETERIIVSEKSCTGLITSFSKGSAGFGYDPIFMPTGYDKTFAELGDEVKRKISHRALAIKDIAERLIPVIQYDTV